MIASVGVLKNVGMLWGDCLVHGTLAGREVWLWWVAGLVVTVLAAGSSYCRVSTVRWTRHAVVGDDEVENEDKVAR